LFKIKSGSSYRKMNASDLNNFLGSISGEELSAKDFRTLHASALAIERLAGLAPPESKTKSRREVTRVSRVISESLSNTPAIVRKSYIHQEILEHFDQGKLGDLAMSSPRRHCSKGETLLLAFLSRSAQEK
jgi:DNA topoisomerase-1